MEAVCGRRVGIDTTEADQRLAETESHQQGAAKQEDPTHVPSLGNHR